MFHQYNEYEKKLLNNDLDLDECDVPEKYWTEEFCLNVIKLQPNCAWHIPKKMCSDKVMNALFPAVEVCPDLIINFPVPLSKEIYLAATSRKFSLFNRIPQEMLDINAIKKLAEIYGYEEVVKRLPRDLFTEDLCLSLVKSDGNLISFFPKEILIKNKKICMISIQKNGENLDKIPPIHRTADVFLEAVKRTGTVLGMIPVQERTPIICEEAIKQNGLALEFILENIEKYYLPAIRQNGKAIKFIPEMQRTYEHYRIAVEHDYYGFGPFVILDLVPEKYLANDELYRIAVQKRGSILSKIPKNRRSPEVCFDAVKENISSFEFVPKESLRSDLILFVTTKNGLLLKEIPIEFRSREICLSAVTNNPMALNWVPAEFKADIINKLTLENILSRKFGAIQFLPKEINYECQINLFLSAIEFITIRNKNNEENDDFEIIDIENVYRNKDKHHRKIVSISDSENPESDLLQILSLIKSLNVKQAITFTLIGHSNVSSSKLAGIHHTKIVEICKSHPYIKHIKLLGCNLAKSLVPETEKIMLQKISDKINKEKKLKYGLIATNQVRLDDRLQSFEKFCVSNKLNGVYILNKRDGNSVELLSIKLKEKNELTKKIKIIPQNKLSHINKILSGQKNNSFPFPKNSDEILSVRDKAPLSIKELKLLRQLGYEEERFERNHPLFKRDKSIYPFLATVQSEPSKLLNSLLKKIVDGISEEAAITWNIEVSGPTQALHVDTEKERFLVTRTNLYSDYRYNAKSLYGTKQPNIFYKRLIKEREGEIVNMQNQKGDSELSRAKTISVSVRKS